MSIERRGSDVVVCDETGDRLRVSEWWFHPRTGYDTWMLRFVVRKIYTRPTRRHQYRQEPVERPDHEAIVNAAERVYAALPELIPLDTNGLKL